MSTKQIVTGISTRSFRHHGFRSNKRSIGPRTAFMMYSPLTAVFSEQSCQSWHAHAVAGRQPVGLAGGQLLPSFPWLAIGGTKPSAQACLFSGPGSCIRRRTAGADPEPADHLGGANRSAFADGRQPSSRDMAAT